MNLILVFFEYFEILTKTLNYSFLSIFLYFLFTQNLNLVF